MAFGLSAHFQEAEIAWLIGFVSQKRFSSVPLLVIII